MRDVAAAIHHDDPYLRPGFLLKNGTDSLTHFWVPFDPTVSPPPHLLRSVIERKPLPWLNGKTLLLVGDSVDRYAVEHFCDLVSGEFLRTDLTTLVSEINREGQLSHNTNPVICRVQDYNFEVISFSHYGMYDEADDYWSFKYFYTGPGLMENRIPLLRSLFAEYKREPDIIILSSGLSSSYT